MVLLSALLFSNAQGQSLDEEYTNAASKLVNDLLSLDSTSNEYGNIFIRQTRKMPLRRINLIPMEVDLKTLSKKHKKQGWVESDKFTSNEFSRFKALAKLEDQWQWKTGLVDQALVMNYGQLLNDLIAQDEFSAWQSFSSRFGPGFLRMSMPLFTSDYQYAVIEMSYVCGLACEHSGIFICKQSQSSWQVLDCISYILKQPGEAISN